VLRVRAVPVVLCVGESSKSLRLSSTHATKRHTLWSTFSGEIQSDPMPAQPFRNMENVAAISEGQGFSTSLTAAIAFGTLLVHLLVVFW